MLSELHALPTTRHSGFHKTYERIKHSFFSEDMKQHIYTFVVECDTCQRIKGKTTKLPRTLQPLPIPATIWMDISMDFIAGLPKYENKYVIMVVVDIISKYAHFCALPHLFTTSIVAQIFMDNIFKLHGCTPLLSPIVIQVSLENFGRNCSISREPNCISSHPIISD
jgi:hypothetical protein